MDDSAQSRPDSVTVEELRECMQVLDQQIIDALETFYLLTGITIASVSLVAKTRSAPTGDEEINYKIEYGCSFDCASIPNA